MTFLLVGCGDGPSASNASGGGAPGAGGALSRQEDPALEDAGLFGTLTDESGETIGDTQVLACMTSVCLFGKAGHDGRFAFSIEPPTDLALKTLEKLDTTPRRAALLMPVRFEESTLDVGAVRIPTLPDGVALVLDSPEALEYAAGDGIVLRIVSRDLVPRLGDKLRDVAARRVPPADLRPIPGLEREEVVAAYALHPFAAVCTSAIAVRAEVDLPSGTRVNFRTISELDGHLSAAAAGTADGRAVETDPGTGIHELTWLVISRETTR